jgi:hypothetical protein
VRVGREKEDLARFVKLMKKVFNGVVESVDWITRTDWIEASLLYGGHYSHH